MFTNGYTNSKVKDPSKFEWIRVSLTPEYFTEKVLYSIKKYSQYTTVGINLNYVGEDIDFLKDLVKKSKEAGANYFQVRPALAAPGEKQKIYKFPSELRRLATDTFQIEFTGYKWQNYLKPRSYTKCYGPQFIPTIWADGNVMTCNYHPGKEDFIFGNLNEKGFVDIWNSLQKKKIMDNLKGSMLKNCQICCKANEINNMLFFLKDGKIDHKDFI
jgi:radical SAM protein with 4Fe4S-binding SPASM domain